MRIRTILTPSHGLPANHCRAMDNGKQFTDRLFEPPRVYRRVKLSKDEPYGTEEIPPEVHG